MDIVSLSNEVKENIAEKYHLDLLVVFGSYGTADFHYGESDIDVAFLAGEKLSGKEVLELVNNLTSIIKYSKIDLVDLSKASGLLKYEVASKGRKIYERQEGLFERYSLYCYRYYYDTHKFRQLRKEYLQDKLGV